MWGVELTCSRPGSWLGVGETTTVLRWVPGLLNPLGLTKFPGIVHCLTVAHMCSPGMARQRLLDLWDLQGRHPSPLSELQVNRRLVSKGKVHKELHSRLTSALHIHWLTCAPAHPLRSPSSPQTAATCVWSSAQWRVSYQLPTLGD